MSEDPVDSKTLETKVLAAALELFEGDRQMTERWLWSPLPIIGNEAPYNYMDSPVRAKHLLGIINRFEHGVWT
ncbi:MAG: DUF2384 domain-containing protein [Oceanospirillales bacterium]|nr:DUF2384 domain-containing protein [Oceanospirillales bacterium]